MGDGAAPWAFETTEMEFVATGATETASGLVSAGGGFASRTGGISSTDKTVPGGLVTVKELLSGAGVGSAALVISFVICLRGALTVGSAEGALV